MTKKNIPTDAILLFSGGLDSFCQWRLLGMPKAIYFDIGNRAGVRERAIVEAIREKYKADIIISNTYKLGWYEGPSGYIPYRNLFFLMRTALLSENVIMCSILEYAPDKNRHFYRKTESLLNEIGRGHFQGISKKVKIWTPFASYTKTQLVREYLRYFDAEDLKFTTSCYSGMPINCGKCSGCVTRYIAMRNNEILEPYAEVPTIQSLSDKWDIRDFKLTQVPMYWKRWRELQEFKHVIRDH